MGPRRWPLCRGGRCPCRVGGVSPPSPCRRCRCPFSLCNHPQWVHWCRGTSPAPWADCSCTAATPAARCPCSPRARLAAPWCAACWPWARRPPLCWPTCLDWKRAAPVARCRPPPRMCPLRDPASPSPPSPPRSCRPPTPPRQAAGEALLPRPSLLAPAPRASPQRRRAAAAGAARATVLPPSHRPLSPWARRWPCLPTRRLRRLCPCWSPPCTRPCRLQPRWALLRLP